MEDEDVIFVRLYENQNLKFIREVSKFYKQGLHDEDEIMSSAVMNSQKNEYIRHHGIKVESKQNNIFKKQNSNHKININDDEDTMIKPKHKHRTNPKTNSNIKTQINNQMNRMNNDSQFKSIHKSIDTTSTPDEIKLYKRVSHINDESFKDRYCNLLKDLQTRITWEREKLHEQFKTKFQNKIRINNETV